MSFLHWVDYILLIRPHQLVIYNLYSTQVFKVDFPESVLNYQELINKEKFSELIGELVKKEKLFNKKALIFLSEELVFEKIVKNEDIDKNQELLTSVFEEIPLAPLELDRKILRTSAETFLWGTNKTIFEEVKRIVENNGWSILGVVPINAYPKFKGQKDFQAPMFKEMISNRNYLNQVDFLNEEEVVTSKSNNNYRIIILITILILASLTGFYYLNRYQEFSKFDLKTIIVPSSAPSIKTKKITSKLTPTISENKIDNYQVIILNGSGIEGEAAVLQTQLEKSGYSVSRIDNADDSNYTDTLISASKGISKEILDKLKDELNEMYIVEDEVSTASTAATIQIIIGQNTR